jgi:hypothetical protein
MKIATVSPADHKPLISDETAPVPRQMEESAAPRASGSHDSVSISQEAWRLYTREVQRRLSGPPDNPDSEVGEDRDESRRGSAGQLFHSKA